MPSKSPYDKIRLIESIADQFQEFLEDNRSGLHIKAILYDSNHSELGHHYSPIVLITQICAEYHKIQLLVHNQDFENQNVDIRNLDSVILEVS